MADAYKTIYQGQLPNAVATIATVGGGKSWIIRSVVVVNTDTATRTFQVLIGGTVDANTWIGTSNDPISLRRGETYEWDGVIALAAAETIAGVASVASKLTITISGDEVS